MKTLLIGSVSALAIMAGSAYAADVVPPPPAFSWTGIHAGIGGGAGYNTYDAKSEFDVSNPWSPLIPGEMDIKGNDLGSWYGFGTVEIGADWQPDGTPFVIGILGSYDFNGDNGAEASSNSSDPEGDCGPSLIDCGTTANIKAKLEDSWFLGARAGFAFRETSLLYVLGGYTWVDGKVKSLIGFNTEDGDDYGFIDKKDNVDGWTLGAGIEEALTDWISLKIEYRHDFLDDIKWSEAAFDPDWGGVDPDNTMHGRVNFDRDTIRAVLSLRFNPLGG
jgi:outer membrane immunogenic protein